MKHEQIKVIGDYLREHLEPILPRFNEGGINWNKSQRETKVEYHSIQKLMNNKSNLTEKNIDKLLEYINSNQNNRSNT